jgi:Glycosyl transferases group 1
VKLALLMHALPQPSSSGAPITGWAILEQMLAAGHEVAVLSLVYPSDPFDSEERRQLVCSTGAELVLVPVVPGAPDERLWMLPTASLRPALCETLTAVAPDAILAYHWDVLAATHGLRVAPRFGVVDDPWHLPNLRRWQATRPRPTLHYLRWTRWTLRGIRPATRAMVELLEDCEASACFQAEAAAWLGRKGASACRYVVAPVPDAGGHDWAERRGALRSPKPRILLGPSNLAATSTSAGIRLFARKILPVLERELGPEGFEVHVVGEGEPPAELARLLPRPSVIVRGRVEPADHEFLASDVQLVPTPFVLGKRVRIIVGFSFGCCVVAHAADAVNLPELADGDNALVAADGEGLARAVVRAVRDGELRARLSAGARRTFEELFRPEAAGRRIVETLERLAAGRPAAAVDS